MKSVIFAGVLAVASMGAHAGDFYVLGDIGLNKLELKVDDATYSKTDTMFDLGAGYGFNENFAVEFAYRDLGKLSESDDYGSASIELTSLQLSALGKLPVNDALYFYGRMGFAQLSADYSYESYTSPQFNDSDSRKKTKVLVGLGLGYNITSAVSLRAEYIRHAKWEDVTFSSLSLGATYSF